MMKNAFDLLFFGMYNWFYNKGKVRRSSPWFQATANIAIGTSLWIYFVIAVYFQFWEHTGSIPIPSFVYLITAALFYILYHRIWIFGKKYEIIYLKYKDLDKVKKRMIFIYAISFLFLPAIFIVLLGLYRVHII